MYVPVPHYRYRTVRTLPAAGALFFFLFVQLTDDENGSVHLYANTDREISVAVCQWYCMSAVTTAPSRAIALGASGDDTLLHHGIFYSTVITSYLVEGPIIIIN
jgi:hypothetical protein